MVIAVNPRQGIIGIILKAFQGERSVSGVYHLLSGKKSAQTIQDGSLFSVLSYFGVFPQLKRPLFDQDIQAFVEAGDATLHDDEYAVLTEQGLNKLARFQLNRPELSHLNGWNYHAYTRIVWLRLCLFLQSLSFLVKGEKTFYPVTHQIDIQNWVRKNIPQNQGERKRKLSHLHEELMRFLSTCKDEEAFVIAQQLSGKSKVGFTHAQLADHLEKDVTDVYLIHLVALHKLFNVLEMKEEYPTLFLFIADLKRKFVLTESARKTLHYIEQGLSVERISQLRKLKENTIEDHLVEIAFQNEQFSIRPFVNEEEEKTINERIDQCKTSRLRELKEHLPSSVSYFMIRLVLARKKVQHET